MKITLRNLFLFTLMLLTAALAIVLRPTQKVADLGGAIDLELLIPTQFAEWREEKQASTLIVDAQQKAFIDRIYKQTLSRVYVSSNGARVMLSLAYGDDQRDAVQLHFPEVCYPAQGFQILSTEKDVFDTGFGLIRIKHLMATSGGRFEAVTYWTMIGERVVQGGVDTKLVQMAYGLKGQIPSGLLFRISSINPDQALGYMQNKAFARDLISSLSPENRLRVIGLPREGLSR